ncbi:MAG: group II intron maturase-specific domain-containing protein [Syntrophales bacterium]
MVQAFKKIFSELDSWMRDRVRSMQLKKWKKLKRFQSMMIYSGYEPHEAHRVWDEMNE